MPGFRLDADASRLGQLGQLGAGSTGGRSGVKRGRLDGLAPMVWAAPSRTPSAPCAMGGVACLACQMCAGVRSASSRTDTLPPIPPILPMLCQTVILSHRYRELYRCPRPAAATDSPRRHPRQRQPRQPD